MGIVVAIAHIILLVSYLIAARLRRHLVAVNNRYPILWSAITFVFVFLTMSFGVLFVVAINFHR